MDQTVRAPELRPLPTAADWPSPTRAWATVFVLMAAYALAFGGWQAPFGDETVGAGRAQGRTKT